MSDPVMYTIEAVRADGLVGKLHLVVDGETMKASFVPLEGMMTPDGVRYACFGGIYEDVPWSSGHNFKRAQELELATEALPHNAPESVRAAYLKEAAIALQHACLNRSCKAHGPWRPEDEADAVSAAKATLSDAGWSSRGELAARRAQPDAPVYCGAHTQCLLEAAERALVGRRAAE